MRIAQTSTPENRRRASEQGFHQRGQLDHAVAGVSHADADPDRQAARHLRHLRQEPALAHPGPALDQDDSPCAGKELVKVLAQGRELDVTATDRLRGLRCLRSNRVRSHYRPFG